MVGAMLKVSSHSSTTRTTLSKNRSVAALVPTDLMFCVTSAVTALGAVVSYDEKSIKDAGTLLLEIGSENVRRHAVAVNYATEHKPQTLLALASWEALKAGKLELLEGISDLILYPIEANELKHRLKPHVQPFEPDISDNGGVLHFGDVSFNLQSSSILAQGAATTFTSKEFSVLLFLARQDGRPVDHMELGVEALKIPRSYPTIENTVNVHIARIRSKLRRHSLDSILVTIRNQGFYLKTNLANNSP
jgi:DNA-binding response OmpR family regulator